MPIVFGMFSGEVELYLPEIQILLMSLISLVFTFCLMGFVCFHVYLVCNNRTTIENFQKSNYKVDGDPIATKYLNMFDIGYSRNLKEIMGNNPLLWLLPINNS